MPEQDEVCSCETFTAATKNGTDSQGYSAAAWNVDGEWQFGIVDEPVRFCPWCGKKARAAGE